VEIQIDVPFVDVQICNLWIFLSHRVKPFYKSVGELAGLCIDLSFDAEHTEGLLDILFAENVWELLVYMHVKEHFFSDQALG